MIKLAYGLDEVFEMAEQMERNGAAFYRRAARSVGTAGMRNLLRKLAEDEDTHRKTFATMRSNLVPEDARINDGDAGGIVSRYLQALAGHHVFPDGENPAAAVSGCRSARDLLGLALTRERDSILHYVGLRSLIAAEADRSKLDLIIFEEQKHIVLLTEMQIKLCDS